MNMSLKRFTIVQFMCEKTVRKRGSTVRGKNLYYKI